MPAIMVLRRFENSCHRRHGTVASKGDVSMRKIAVIGSGAWGTTLARLVALEEIRKAQSGDADSGEEIAEVTLWEHLPQRAAQMQWGRENQSYLPGFPLPANIRVTADVADAVRGRDIVLIVTPAQRVRENVRALAPDLLTGGNSGMRQQGNRAGHALAYD